MCAQSKALIGYHQLALTATGQGMESSPAAVPGVKNLWSDEDQICTTTAACNRLKSTFCFCGLPSQTKLPVD